MNLEVFSCSGGLAAGFRRAGIEFDLVFDRDPDACASYEANLGQRPVQMDARDLVRMVRAGWRLPVVDLLVADPPCTPWSRAGKRKGLADERDMLEETAELIALLRPRAYLIGNIPGLDDKPNLRVVQRVIGGLAKHGYCVVDYANLDAADYGVPQRRARPFWFGHLDGPCIRWPAPTHGDPARAALPGLGLRPWVTCREALAHLPFEELGRPVRMKIRPAAGGYGSDQTRCSAPGRPASTIVSRPTSKGGGILIGSNRHGRSWDDHPPSQLDQPARTVKSDGGRMGRPESVLTLHDLPQSARPSSPESPALTVNAKVPRAGEGNALLAWPWPVPSTTVHAAIAKIAAPGEHEGHKGPNAIVLSERAAAILQGFPDGWTFAGATKRARWSQLGQAVPPAVAEAIGRAIVEQRARARAGAAA